MIKKELLQCIAEKTNQPVSVLDEVLTALVDCITKTIATGDKLTIPDLGTFSMRERAAREGRNPKTGESITIAARKAPHFSAATGLKKALNG